MISFNEPIFSKKGMDYIGDAILLNKRLNGDGVFTKKCSEWIANRFGINKVLMTTSCTHSLEMASLLIDTNGGDEVIMPSYTFVSTATAFVIRGARIKFVDIRKDTLNIDETLIEAAITPKTKAIVVVHYAGVSCEMDTILDIARRYNLYVIEDAAQGVMASYKGKKLGGIGDLGAYSFHETKNYTMGEGGAILINHSDFFLRSEIIREKGTNRNQYFRGEIDKYSWVDIGSSYLPSEMNVAYLYAQLEEADEINNKRMALWNTYYKQLQTLMEKGRIELPHIPKECEHNAHMFYIKTKDLEERTKLIDWLKENEILACFHYVPLHSSKAGQKYGEFVGKDVYTTAESERLLRLPLYHSLQIEQLLKVVEKIEDFYKK